MRNLLARIYKLLFFRTLSAKCRLDELIWAQTFDFAIRDSKWFVRQTLNPGRWAMGFAGLYVLYRTLAEMKPDSILEMGLGESSKLTFQYASHFPDKHLTIIEQSEEWRDIFCDNVFDARRMVRVLPLETKGSGRMKHYSYSGLTDAVGGRKYDLIVIDGPWGSRRDSRNQILDLIERGMLNDRFVIILDDAERDGEKDTIRKMRKLLTSQGREFYERTYKGKKNTYLVCSPECRFLASL